jgi:LEA14-like dessication related protein
MKIIMELIMKYFINKKYLLLAGMIVIITQLFSCATLKQFANIQKPTVDVQNVRLTGMSFDALNLAFDMKITNPNPLSVSLAGFDYDFQIADASFLKGNQTKAITLKAKGESILEIPLTLNFKDLYSTFQALKNADSTKYKMLCGLSFDLPVIGATRIPVSKTGTLPNLKMPDISIGSLKLNNISLNRADMELKINVKNANTFGFLLNKLNYNFAVNGTTWANGLSDKQMQVTEKGEGTIAIPISLNFIEMDASIYKIVSGGQKLNYQLKGDVDMNSTLPLLSKVNLPIDRAGEINISK